MPSQCRQGKFGDPSFPFRRRRDCHIVAPSMAAGLGARGMHTSLPEYEIYAIRYATREGFRRDNFIGGDAHDGPMPMDYYSWVAVGSTGAYVIDTGFTAEMARARKRSFL